MEKTHLQSISPISEKINCEYKKKYSKLLEQYKESSKGESLNISFPALKRDFSEILTKLDGITEKRFRNNYMSLTENESLTGLIDKGDLQYFSIKVSGKKPPIVVKFSRERGLKEVFASFRLIHPNPTSYDYKSSGDNFEIPVKDSKFIESKLYIGILAKTDCLLSICCRFGEEKPTKQVNFKKKRVPKHVSEFNRHLEIQEHLKASTSKMTEKRRIAHSVNYIRLNCLTTSLATATVKGQKLQSLHNKSQKVLEIQQRKKQLVQERSAYFQKKLNDRELNKLLFEQERLRVTALSTTLKFIKQWVVLVFLLKLSSTWKQRYQDKQEGTQQLIFQKIAAFRLQRAQKKRHPHSFALKHRELSLARNNLSLFASSFTHSSTPLLCLLHESATNSQLTRAFTHYTGSVLKLQRQFKKLKLLYEDMFDELFILWGHVAADLAALIGDTPNLSKQEKTLGVTIPQIPSTVKTEVLLNYLQNVKFQVLRDIKSSGHRVVFIKYWPTDEAMGELIKAAASIVLAKRRTSKT